MTKTQRKIRHSINRKQDTNKTTRALVSPVTGIYSSSKTEINLELKENLKEFKIRN